MKEKKTAKTRYEELKTMVPKEIREEFEQMEAGIRVPPLYEDRPFKRIFDPDMHCDRDTKLFQLIYHKQAEVLHSLKEEGSKASIYSKKTILDILARLSNHGLCDFEMQVTAQEFIVQRMDVYASDLMMMQYSIRKGEKKKEFQFSDMADTYCVVFMKHSPNIFKDHTSFIHYKQEITDTGITLKSCIHIVYIELDKCLEQVSDNTYPKEQEELCFWLVLMADINSDTAKKVLKANPEMAEIYLELGTMSKDREEMAEMLLEKYDETVRCSELNQAKNEGKAEGKAEALLEILEEYGTVPESIRNAIFSQSELCVLKKWIKTAVEVNSIKEFVERM